jgi:putative endonuclease
MPDTRRALGSFGEDVAAAHLLRLGYELVARGWRCGTGELDLVARKGDQLVFVEVRTRRGAEAGTPEESVTAAKQARLAALAHAYVDANDVPADASWRIDVIAVVVGRAGRVARLTHIEHAIEI